MHKFDTAAAIAAVLTIPAGRVQVIAAERADTTVEVRPTDPAKRSDVRAAERTTVAYADSVLRIRTDGSETKGSIEVTLQVPAGSGVEATAASAEFRTVGRLGDLVVEGAYREIVVDEAASVRLSAVDGDVRIGRLGGPAEISTTRGDIRIAEAAGGAVVLSTRSGDIEIAAAAGVSAALDAGAGHGRVSNALANDGGATLAIRATTDHGDIVARSL